MCVWLWTCETVYTVWASLRERVSLWACACLCMNTSVSPWCEPVRASLCVHLWVWLSVYLSVCTFVCDMSVHCMCVHLCVGVCLCAWACLSMCPVDKTYWASLRGSFGFRLKATHTYLSLFTFSQSCRAGRNPDLGSGEAEAAGVSEQTSGRLLRTQVAPQADPAGQLCTGHHSKAQTGRRAGNQRPGTLSSSENWGHFFLISWREEE